jgi:uncharacterized iron-regulated membrane protein
MLKNFFAMRTDKKPRRAWLDAHNVVGIISVPFHIVIVITSVVFAYHDPFYGVQNQLVHDGKLGAAFQSGIPKPDPQQSTNPIDMVDASILIESAQTESDSFKPYMLQYAAVNSLRAQVRVWGRDDSAVAPRAPGGFVVANPYTGNVDSIEYMPGKQSAESVTLSSFFALHFATYGGMAVKWMYFFLGLAGAWLFYTGNLLWIENRRKVQRKKPTCWPATQRRSNSWSLNRRCYIGLYSGDCSLIGFGKVVAWLHR